MRLGVCSNLGRKGILLFFMGALVLLYVGPDFLSAMDPHKNISQYIHEVWLTDDGLPQNSIMNIIQTKDGYLWLGTEVGLVRFNGVEFTPFDSDNTEVLRKNYISALFEDSKGILWIGTYGGGLLRYSQGIFYPAPIKNGLSRNVILAIEEGPSGNLWIGTNGGGLIRLQGDKQKIFTKKDGLPNDHIFSLSCSGDGKLWAGTRAGLARKEEAGFSVLTMKDGLSHNAVLAVCEDQNGILWAGTPTGLNRLGKEGIRVYTTKDGLSHDFIAALCLDRNGNLWAGTHKGLNRINEEGIKSFTAEDGLSNDFVRMIYEDREGSLWVGTYGGLNQFKDGKFLTLTEKDGLGNNYIKTVLEDRTGTIWVGTYGGGLVSLKDEQMHTMTERDGLINDYIRALYEDKKGRLWIGTYHGLNCLNGGRIKTYTTEEGLSHNIISAVGEDEEGVIWIGTNGGGLNRLENGRFSIYTTEQGLSQNVITSLYFDRNGNLWIGTEGGGLNLFKDGMFTVYTDKEGLADNAVYDIYEDSEDRLWIATNGGGISIFEQGTFFNITKKQGLTSNFIFRILEDDTEHFWIGCHNGILRVRKSELLDAAAGKNALVHPVHYGRADGMKRSECSGGTQPSGWKDKDGRMWFPTIHGLVMIDPRIPSKNAEAPPVVIESIRVDARPVDSNRKVVLSAGSKNFDFFYAGLSYISPGKVKYRYMLEGLDEDWVEAGTRRHAHYARIPPGRYSFTVTACNNDGVWNTQGASFDFRLKPYFYQTVSFYLLTAFFVGFIGVGTHQYRVKRLSRRKKELEKEVAVRTAELRLANKELQDFAYIVSHDLKAPLRGVDQLAGWFYEDYSGSIDEKGRKNLELMVQRVDRMHKLIDGILQYSRAGRLREKMIKLDLNVVVEEVVENITPPSHIAIKIQEGLPVILGDRARIEQVFQNLIDNAVKYMDKPEGRIRVGCEDAGEYWKFTVSDNGPGIDEAYREKIFKIFQTLETSERKDSTGIGLSIVKKVIEQYGGKIWVDSDPGNGCTFTFTMPK
ncbi:MAG: GHKL domain-containing protein [Candidatus Aminicenantes bacterium]|nr:GHKL domain-containing protein [Candidatus Aminicenantes bacterium]